MRECFYGPNADKLKGFRKASSWVAFKRNYLVPERFMYLLVSLNYLGFRAYGSLWDRSYMPMTSCN